MSKPWLDTWKATLTKRGGELDRLRPGRKEGMATFMCGSLEICAQYAAFAAAAPDMCRALLACEKKLEAIQEDPCAPSANYELFAIDAALTKAGLPDQASRDAAREATGLSDSRHVQRHP